MDPLRKRLIMLIISFLLLIAAAVYATTAWFTKMVSAADMEFTVAKWDFTANQELQDMVINIYEYGSLNGENLVAPGTAGYIPIQLSAENSDTAVDYYVTVDKSQMSPEFQRRINIYYIGEDSVRHDFKNDGNDMRGTLPPHGLKTVIIYWEWIYELQAGSDGTPTQAEIDAFNEFDTEVGRNPELYAKYMNATIRIAGAQVKPETEEVPPSG